MGNLYFPQLTSGALAQYPIQKTRIVPTIKNVLLDGSMVLSSDLNFNSQASRLIWQLSYTDLDSVDIQALQMHFAACSGRFRSFTFIDPTDNMLVSSVDLTAANWQREAIQLTLGASDPQGGTQGTVLTNVSQSTQQISQTLLVPSNYQYCWSAYIRSTQTGEVLLTRYGASASASTSMSIGPTWTRAISSGRLNDAGTNVTVGIVLAPGQQVTVYGLQLEAQVQPSRYRATGQTGGVYPSAHWATDELAVVAQAPNLFSTYFSIETNL